jgi:hypothetical protein
MQVKLPKFLQIVLLFFFFINLFCLNAIKNLSNDIICLRLVHDQNRKQSNIIHIYHNQMHALFSKLSHAEQSCNLTKYGNFYSGMTEAQTQSYNGSFT